MKFQSLGLAEPILRAVTEEGYSTPTPIQAKAIPHILEGKDLLGCAQTGTGKTAAFALPILHRLTASIPPAAAKAAVAGAHPAPAAAGHASHASHAGHAGHAGHADKSDHHHKPAARSPHITHTNHNTGQRTSGRTLPAARVLVLSPTRELALQIAESFETYGRNLRLTQTVIFGGVGQGQQVAALKRGVDIIVATPGRLLDLMEQGYVNLAGIEIFVLDEADRMLDMGFIADIRKIVAKLPQKRQTLMFSATMPRDIRQLADTILRSPVSVEVAPVSSTAELVQQAVYMVDKSNKPALLAHLLQKGDPFARTIVFTRTKHGADKLVKSLKHHDIAADAIHGNKRQNIRQKTLDNFRTGRTPVLIATDIAARGIDIDEIQLVVNYDIPNIAETYVHRIGRTGRAGASGRAVAFCDRDERFFLKDIEKLIRKPIPVLDDQPAYPARAHTERDDGSDERGGRGRGGHGASHRGGQRGPSGAPRKSPRTGGGAGHRGQPGSAAAKHAGKPGAHKAGTQKPGGHSKGSSTSGTHPRPHKAGSHHAETHGSHGSPAGHGELREVKPAGKSTHGSHGHHGGHAPAGASSAGGGRRNFRGGLIKP